MKTRIKGKAMKGKPAAGGAHRAFRAGDRVYILMPPLVEKALRVPMDDEEAPEETAVVNGVSATPTPTVIKTNANVVTTLDAEGNAGEAMVPERDRVLLQKLGAKTAGSGILARSFLSLPANPYAEKNLITIEVLWPKPATFHFKIASLGKKVPGGKVPKEKLKKLDDVDDMEAEPAEPASEGEGGGDEEGGED